MASRNKVARRKGKGGGGDEVSRFDWAGHQMASVQTKLGGN